MAPRYLHALTSGRFAVAYSESVTRDQMLISRFTPVMRAGLASGLPDATPQGQGLHRPAAIHAEVLHQLCLTDGLLELLDWTHQGLAADPAACLWLGSLRWHRLVTGDCPADAPAPPARDVDHSLQQLLGGEAPLLEIVPGTGAVSCAGLASGEMAYRGAPAQPDADDPVGLVRLVPLALVPYVDDAMRHSWAGQALSLTQGHRRLHDDAHQLLELIHRLALQIAPDATQVQDAVDQAREIMAQADDVAAAVVVAQVRAAGGAPESGAEAPRMPTSAISGRLADVLESAVLAPWRTLTAPA